MSYLYTHPSQMTPLVPGERASAPLLEKAAQVIKEANRLAAKGPAQVRQLLRDALMPLNAFYSNKIEGLHATPSLTLSALAGEYNVQHDIALKQWFAKKQVQTECWGEKALLSDAAQLFSPCFVNSIHYHLFFRSDADLAIDPSSHSDKSDAGAMILEAGVLRHKEVKVGNHIPPKAETLPTFLDFWSRGYKKLSSKEHALIALLASHHRLTWIHPYLDGNGRTCRLHTHFGLHALDLTHGLWSINRGFALTKESYYQYLDGADQHRQGDIDGRGNLSEKGLVQFIDYSLDVCLEQIRFMSEQLSTEHFGKRLHTLLAVISTESGGTSLEKAHLPLLHLAAYPQLTRGEFKAMTMVPDRTADRILKRLLELGLLASATPRGPVSLALPVSQWRYLFPSLWREAE